MDIKRSFLVLSLLLPITAFSADNTKCVSIFYDLESKSLFSEGRLNAINLQNLLGHFPQYQQYIVPISWYKKNDINRCQASIYLSTNADAELPKVFLEDFE